MVGRKRALIIGLVGFAGASAIGGASVNFAMLVIARTVQGAFGALLAPSVLALLTTTFSDPGERGQAFGIYGAIAGAGGALGLLLVASSPRTRRGGGRSSSTSCLLRLHSPISKRGRNTRCSTPGRAQPNQGRIHIGHAVRQRRNRSMSPSATKILVRRIRFNSTQGVSDCAMLNCDPTRRAR